MTVGLRDLSRQNFKPARAEFRDSPYQRSFNSDRVTLPIHDGNQWQVDSHHPWQRLEAT
ncbi:hypothetical protein [Rubidibacter lacunae]|uniref:hypothetical protein n=1 Tax=Rubidibacter lacunae TaxID=582514 RepID=UPI000414B9E4|nr:hypothetical protein [Rubidibacter lacunae]